MIKLRLTKPTQADLDDIRELVAKKNYSEFRGDRNRLKLSEVYREVMAFSGFRVNGIDATCDSCLNDAVNIVYNFIMHHEQKPGDKTAKVIEIAGGRPLENVVEKMTDAFNNLKDEKPTNEEEAIVTVHPTGDLTVHWSNKEKQNAMFEEMEYKDILALAKEKGYKGGRIPKKELIDFLTKKGE